MINRRYDTERLYNSYQALSLSLSQQSKLEIEVSNNPQSSSVFGIIINKPNYYHYSHYSIRPLFTTRRGKFAESTGVLEAGSDALHGEDERIFQSGSVLARGVELHELVGWLARVHLHDLLGQMRAHLHAVGGVSDPLQGVDLAHVEHRDVRVPKPQPLPQVGVSLQDFLVSGNLTNRGTSFY